MTPDAPHRLPMPALLMLSAAVFLSVTTEMVPTGLLPMMSRDLGVDISRLGLLVTAYAFMVALFAAPLGAVTARLPRRPLLVAALLGYAVCNLVTAAGTTYSVTMVSRLAGGLIHGLFWAMLAGYVARMVPGERVGRAVTVVFTGGTAAILGGVPAGTALGGVIGWRGTFVLLSAVSVGLALLGMRMLPAIAGARPERRVPLRTVLASRAVVLVVAMTGLTMLGHFSFFSYVAPYLIDAGLPEQHVGLVLFGYGLAGAGGLAVAGAVIDRRPRSSMAAAAVLLSGSLLVLVLGGAGHLAVAVAATIASGLALGALPVMLQAATLRAAPHAPEQVSALGASAFNIGIGGGALLGGLAVHHVGVAALPALAVMLTGLGLVPVLVSLRPASVSA